MECFALLDDHTATAAQPHSRLYTGFLREVGVGDDPKVVQSQATLTELWSEVVAAQRAGAHALVLVDYEWDGGLVGAGHARDNPCSRAWPAPTKPVYQPGRLRVLLFAQLQTLSASEVDAWLVRQTGAADAAAGVLNMRTSVDETAFNAAIARIHQAILDGETYQVNYSYRLDFEACGAPLALYRQLRVRQPVAYGALIALPDGSPNDYVLSFSPELFLRNDGGHLTARPMKGTAARTGDAVADAISCAALGSPKNRSENVMIVDLLRNDLGRVAEVGSVRVPQLFDLETYPSVFQLTSTVTARLPLDCGFPEVLRALFPCGSVTGAPKHHTMELIAELETEPRGLYCGAIGWIDAPEEGAACGNFCLSVAIRTLTLEPAVDGLRHGRLGIGAGIVMDSDAASEHAECETKARFLTGLGAGFSLIETIFATKAGGIRYLDRHLARLSASALRLGFRYVQADVIAALDELVGAGHARESVASRAWPAPARADWAPIRVRLLLHENGECELAAVPLSATLTEPVRLIIAPDALDPRQLLLEHKTTQRQHYDHGLVLAEQAGAFDALFFNTRGELTEGARTNVFLLLDGRWQTPALSCGVLPGIMRSVLLEDQTLNAREAILTHADLLRADEILVCNALRGGLRARLIES